MSNINEILKNSKDLIEIKQQLADYERMEESALSRIFSLKNKIRKSEDSVNRNLEIRNQMYKDYEKALKKASDENKKLHGNTKNAFDRHYAQQNKILRQEERRLKVLSAMNVSIASMSVASGIFTSDFANRRFMNSLKEFDKHVKSASLHLGLSGSSSNILRLNFEGAYAVASQLGAKSSDLYEYQTKYSDETGRATILSSKQLQFISAIARGTGMSSANTMSMIANFELMGVSVENSKEHLESVLYTAERVGINSANIMDSMNKNFKRLQTYNFKQGVYGMSQLAIHTERFKQDMGSVLNSMDKARGLEEVINMSANLQVLGGNFASLADPMQMLFEARNDPEAYANRLGKMTKGLVAMRKTAEGFSFELASPMARDILDNASKSLGISTEELTQQAFRQKELTEKRKQMLGMSLSKDQRLLLEQISSFDSKTGVFTVNVGREVVSLSNLTKNHLKALEIEKTTLEERATSARDFDTIYKSTIESVKSTLLPMMRGVNTVMGWFSDGITKISSLIDNTSPLVQTMAKFTGGIVMLSSILPMVTKSISGYGNYYKKMFGGNKTLPTGVGRSRGRNVSTSNINKSLNIKGGLGAGAGVGLAGVGLGAGVFLAAQGITNISESLSKLSDEKAKTLESITWSLTTLGTVGAIASVAIMAIGKTALVSAPGLLALGGSIALIGTGIGLATAGIGAMGLGMSKMISIASENSDSLFNVASGILAINMATASSLIGGFGIGSLALTLGMIASSSKRISAVGDAFKNIGSVITASTDDFNKLTLLLEKIENFDTKKSNVLNELSNAFKNPLKVSFDEKEVNLISNITLNVDGKKFVEELNLVDKVMVKYNDRRFGKGV